MSFPCDFRCRNTPWVRKGPGPWRAGRSAWLPNAGQCSRAFCPNRYRFGQNAHENWPENVRRRHHGGRNSAGPPPRGLVGHCECPLTHATKRHSARRTGSRPTPVDPRPAGVPSLVLYHGSVPSRCPGSNALSLPQLCASGVLSLVVSISGNLSPQPRISQQRRCQRQLPALWKTLGVR